MAMLMDLMMKQWMAELEGKFVSPFLASSDFCHLLLAIVNSLDPDQDRLSVVPDLDPNRLTLG